ncbi:MAG TPA: DUF3043 domain-containing protein [Streptosporangiaceae bacterium]|nr:DUF3043 domain-containing protein [Streptosporangiaceae bacterium]
MFRRRPSAAAGVLDQDQAAPDSTEADTSTSRPRSSLTPPKGVPTPKRSEAQANRRQPYQAPSDRKAAARQSRGRDRSERARRTEAYQRGEQWAMPRKDQGPVRALARDVVDARRGIGEYYMILMVAVLIILVAVPGNTTKLLFEMLVIFLVFVMIVEGWFVGRKVKRLAAQRFPGESTQGVILYTIMRGVSLRRMRIPRPRVNRGDKV